MPHSGTSIRIHWDGRPVVTGLRCRRPVCLSSLNTYASQAANGFRKFAKPCGRGGPRSGLIARGSRVQRVQGVAGIAAAHSDASQRRWSAHPGSCASAGLCFSRERGHIFRSFKEHNRSLEFPRSRSFGEQGGSQRAGGWA
jgi:hypothetical protein